MKQAGFSLIQLLVGVVLIAITAQIAVPGFAQLMEAQRREDAARQVASGIRSARTEAILRNQVVLVHAIDDDWSRGWRIIVDLNGKGVGDENNPVLIERAYAGKVPIAGNFRGNSYVRFNGLGVPLNSNGTLHVCEAKQPISRYQVILAATGRVRVESNKAEEKRCS